MCTSHWKLNESILNDPIQTLELEKALKEYFLLSDTEGISAESLLAAHKVTMHGKFIHIASQLKRERLADIEKLEREFSLLHSQHKKDPSKVSIAQLDVLRLTLNLALTVKAERKIRWQGAKFYQHRDTIGPMLASKLSPKPHSYTLLKIQLQDGTTTLNPRRIMQSFKAFDAKLYKVEYKVDLPSINSFLENLPILTIGKDHKDTMEAPIAPGPDGFSVPYYKTFADTLATFLTRFFYCKRKGDPLDNQPNFVFMAVIPKPDKNMELVGNYRHILLINNNLKILTKILANHMGYFISHYIHKDQVGFIPGDRAQTRWEEHEKSN